MPNEFRRIVITGLDGTGKSTTAYEAAMRLSDAHKDSDIRIADSNGITLFKGGEPVGHRAEWLLDMEPTEGQSKLRALGQLGLFTAMRQLTELASYRRDNLVIGVRDPYRIDPATYASIYGPHKLQSLSPEQKLKVFDATALAPHPTAIMHLKGDTDSALEKASERETLSPHETKEAMGKLALELSGVLTAYESLYDRPVVEVPALTPHTTDNMAAQIESYLPSTKYIYVSAPSVNGGAATKL